MSPPETQFFATPPRRDQNATNYSQLDLLNLAANRLPASLAQGGWESALRDTARRLPQTGKMGLECRLVANAEVIDLHLPMFRQNDFASLLAHRPREASWGPLYDLAKACLDKSSALSAGIATLWIEADRPRPEDNNPPPAVFAGLRASADRRRLLPELLDLCAPDLSTRRRQSVLDIAARVQAAGGRISHLGFMFSRPRQPLRINIEGVEGRDLADFLRSIGWTGEVTEFDDLLAALDETAEWIRPALDIGLGLLPGIGVELLPLIPANKEAWTRRWLTWMMDRGLCCEEKAAGLMAWPGVDYPFRPEEPWPDALLVEHLVRQPGRLAMLAYGIQHLKLNWQEGICTAKAYLSMRAYWPEAGKAAE